VNFEQRELAIGKVAPEIEGEDADGVPFKLSDYRGRPSTRCSTS
jgi:peroxiredoxin